MVEVDVGEQIWVVIKEGEVGFGALDQKGLLERAEPAVSVVVAPATVLEGGAKAELANGATFDLLPGRMFRTIEDAEEAAEELSRQVP